MTILKRESGCKVGWLTVDDYDEAMRLAASSRTSAVDMAQRGYDFGYQSPGSVQLCGGHHRECSAHTSSDCDCGVGNPTWLVTTP